MGPTFCCLQSPAFMKKRKREEEEEEEGEGEGGREEEDNASTQINTVGMRDSAHSITGFLDTRRHFPESDPPEK